MDWSDVVPHLTGLAHLATVTPAGRPHVSVVAPAIEGDTIWIGTSRSSAKARNVAANPMAAVVWTPGAEAYVDADVEIADDVLTKRRLWKTAWSYDPAMFFDSPDDPDYVLLRLTPRRATVMTMSDAGPSRRRWRADP